MQETKDEKEVKGREAGKMGLRFGPAQAIRELALMGRVVTLNHVVYWMKKELDPTFHCKWSWFLEQ
jgi:hypothetical protein